MLTGYYLSEIKSKEFWRLWKKFVFWLKKFVEGGKFAFRELEKTFLPQVKELSENLRDYYLDPDIQEIYPELKDEVERIEEIYVQLLSLERELSEMEVRFSKLEKEYRELLD